MSEQAIRLPAPLPAQVPILESAAPRKVLRCGRRFGKSRLAMIAGIVGHGPGPDGDKLFPGVLQGRDVVWMAQDYPNLSTVMWKEEFVPRFRHLPFVTMNANEHFISFDGLGTLFLRPETAISGIRGIGKNLGGVILDEAAFYDLESALKDVILPALLDNQGWLILMSTTNAGPDGNSAKRVPSYFNMICAEIKAGTRRDGWQEFTGTAFDNPRLSHDAINELIDEYAPDSPQLQQEVYAALLRAGVGLALPQISDEKHVVDRFPIPDYWRHFGAFDWGFNHPWCFGWFTVDTDGNIYLVDTVWGRGDEPDEIARKIAAAVPVAQMKGIFAGHDIDQRKGRAIGYHGPTIQGTLHAHGIKTTLASIDRVQGLDNFRRYVEWRPTEQRPVEKIPRFRVFRTDGNLKALKQLSGMQLDPKNLEDALGIDADAAGRGGDDAYDMIRYGLMSRPLKSKIGVEYDHAGQEPHHDPNVQLKTIDGKPPRWVGPGDEGHDGFAPTAPTGGFDDYLPNI